MFPCFKLCIKQVEYEYYYDHETRRGDKRAIEQSMLLHCKSATTLLITGSIAESTDPTHPERLAVTVSLTAKDCVLDPRGGTERSNHQSDY